MKTEERQKPPTRGQALRVPPRAGSLGAAVGISALHGPDFPPCRQHHQQARAPPSLAGKTLMQMGSGEQPSAVPTAASLQQ